MHDDNRDDQRPAHVINIDGCNNQCENIMLIMQSKDMNITRIRRKHMKECKQHTTTSQNTNVT